MGNKPSVGDYDFQENSATSRPEIKPFVPGAGNEGDGFAGYDNGAKNDGEGFGQRAGSIDSETALNFPKQQFDENALIYITNMSVQEAESRFTQAEVAHIKREFEKNSKD